MKSIGNEASFTDCLNLRFVNCNFNYHIIRNIERWGRASFGGFNKTVERLAEKMNSKNESDDEDDEEDLEIAQRLKLIREGKYKTEHDDSDEETPKKTKQDRSKFMRPT